MPGEKGWEKFLENEELRIQWAKENCELMGVQKTDEEIKQLVNDPKKIETYRLARKITDREEQCKALADKYKKDGVYESVDPSLARNFSFMLDVSGTPEADEKNIALIKKISTPEGAIEVVNQYVNDCYNFDITKIMVKDQNEAIKAYEENFEDIQKMFVLDSMSVNGSCNKNPKLSQFNMSVTGLIEESVNLRMMVSKCASNYYLTVPEEHFTGPQKEQNVIMGQVSLNNIAKERLDRKDPGTEVEFGVPEKYFQLYFVEKLNEFSEDKIDLYANIDKLKDKGVNFDKDFLKNYKCFDENGQQTSMSFAFKSKKFDEFTFEEYSQEEKDFIKEQSKTAIVDADKVAELDNAGILAGLNYVEDEKVNKAKGTRSTNRINAIRDTLKQVYGIKGVNREIPQMSKAANDVLAFGLVKSLEAKHASRSGIWKFFHPFQNSAEKNAIKEFKDTLKQYKNISEVTFNDKYKNAEIFKTNAEGKYSFEEGKEPIQSLTERALETKQKQQNAIESNEDLHKALGENTNMEPKKEDVKLTEKKEIKLEQNLSNEQQTKDPMSKK